ncbi:uncharacterized protein LOC111043777 [Nilaparvata lugens]|uniref:uncharacterized protein LOC111043777 n=1 Tax=Nilaparvata lugens TaxID=108931 RepID=UPI00193D8CAD|nr:uncharacterized protein LOC111043777 [Nilaparvata lugens]
MESAMVNLERSVKKTDGILDNIAWKLDEFEKEVTDESVKVQTEDTVMNLLESVTQVREDYENLRQELLQVQELQRTVRDKLRCKTYQVEKNMKELRLKLSQTVHSSTGFSSI